MTRDPADVMSGMGVAVGVGGIGVLVGVLVGVGVCVDVGVGVEVGVRVSVGVGVTVGPNNCPGPQPEINKLTAKKQTAIVRCRVFIGVLRCHGCIRRLLK